MKCRNYLLVLVASFGGLGATLNGVAESAKRWEQNVGRGWDTRETPDLGIGSIHRIAYSRASSYEAIWRGMRRMESRLKVIEICAGAGGQSLGLERAGFEHELAIELDETAAETLRLNRPKWDVRVGDVADPKVWKPADYSPHASQGPIDLFAGGVPCPPFSIAGKQLGSSDERDLFAWAIEQVGIIRPRAVLLENVRGLSMPRFAGYRQHVLDRLIEFGYRAEWRLINSSDFGIAQLRPRFVLIAMGHDDFDYFHWPEGASKQVTVGQALRRLMAQNGWEQASEWAKRAGRVGPTVVGGSKKHGGADLGPTRAKQAWAELGVDGRGIADAAPAKGDVYSIGPRLTLDMVARLQGWGTRDFRWKFAGRKTSIYRQIGNAFPPPVARALGGSIAAALNRAAPKAEDSRASTLTDPIYRVLREDGDFVSTEQILRRANVSMLSDDLDVHLSGLSRDFVLERRATANGLSYRLGEFKAFVGQKEHARHDFYKKNIKKVS